MGNGGVDADHHIHQVTERRSICEVLLLVAENPEFAPIVVDPKKAAFAIEGVAVGLVRNGKGW